MNVRRCISSVLLLIFVSIHVVQAIHVHTAPPVVATNSKGAAVQKSVAACQLCDYLLHKQSKEFHQSLSLRLQLFRAEPVTLGHDQLSATRAVMAQLWTNKGPPTYRLSA